MIDGLAARGIGSAHLLPDPHPPPAVPAGVRPRCGRSAAARDGPPGRRGPRDPGPPDARRRRPGHDRRAPCAPSPRRGAAHDDAPLRIGLVGLGLDGPQPRPGDRRASRRRARRGRRSRTPMPSRRPSRQSGAEGWSDPLAMIARGDARRRRSSPPRRRSTARSPMPRSSAGCPCSSRSRSRRHTREALEIVARRACGGRPGPGRSRRALQPGGAASRRAAPRRLAGTILRDRQPARRPVPGADPRRRRHHRPRDARRGHAVVGRGRATARASTPSSPGASTRRTRTCCSGCCTSRPARRACST